LANFQEATFRAIAGFSGASFQGSAAFDQATFHGATFHRATFQDANFGYADFHGPADFRQVVFEKVWQFGPAAVRTALSLSDAVFRQGVEITVSAETIDARRLHLLGGGHLRLRAEHAELDDAEFLAPSILAGQPDESDLAKLETRATKQAKDAWQPRTGRPRVLSVKRANVGTLTLATVDLSDCRFAGAHGLDKLRIEGDVYFAEAPREGSGVGRTRRRVIAEERIWRARQERWKGWQRIWRARRERWKGWYAPAPRKESADPPLGARQIAALYRALRKGLEDSKDEPGAADFYYGEMEMRRHSAASRVERAVLWLYWTVSGYALRASRAVATLVLVLAVATVWFAAIGFGHKTTTVYEPMTPTVGLPPGIAAPGTATPFPGYRPTPVSGERPGWGEALRYRVQSATSLLRAPAAEPLTAWGHAMEIALRFLGPVLLGLAVLSVRGRVKR
jgi:uncharacterized protein YjbI with pentapeptide repeats